MVGSAFYYAKQLFLKWGTTLWKQPCLVASLLYWTGSLFTLHRFYTRQLHECPGHWSQYVQV